MPVLMRRFVLPVLACVLCVAALPHKSAADGPPGRTPGRLAVVLVIDQLRGDEFVALAPAYSRGLRRLVREGRVYEQALHDHGLSETASGHATLGTGKTPSEHGVLDKQVYVRERNIMRGVCDQALALRRKHPQKNLPICDAQLLQTETLGERLKVRSPKSQVVSVAAKARSANLMAGQHVDQVLWAELDEDPEHPNEPPRLRAEGRSAALRRVPAWAADVAEGHRSEGVWRLPTLTQNLAKRPRAGAFASPMCAYGLDFPHVFGRDPHGASSYAARWSESWACSPDSDRFTIDMALRALDELKLGQGGTTDLLLVSLSATDFVGHAFGYESLERAAILAGVDEQIERLFVALERHKERGDFNFTLMFSADHGVNPRVDTARAQGFEVFAPYPGQAYALIDPVLAAWPEETFDYTLRAPFLFLTHPSASVRAQQARAIVPALKRLPGIDEAWTAEELKTAPGEHARLMRRSFTAERGGDVIFTLKKYSKPVTSIKDIAGAWHGGPWRHERHVPFVRWGDVAPERIVDETTIEERLGELANYLGLTEEAAAQP